MDHKGTPRQCKKANTRNKELPTTTTTDHNNSSDNNEHNREQQGQQHDNNSQRQQQPATTTQRQQHSDNNSSDNNRSTASTFANTKLMPRAIDHKHTQCCQRSPQPNQCPGGILPAVISYEGAGELTVVILIMVTVDDAGDVAAFENFVADANESGGEAAAPAAVPVPEPVAAAPAAPVKDLPTISLLVCPPYHPRWMRVQSPNGMLRRAIHLRPGIPLP
jgi:hypothetical protein